MAKTPTERVTVAEGEANLKADAAKLLGNDATTVIMDEVVDNDVSASSDDGDDGGTMSFPEYIARICHEVNRAYCESLGDDSQPEWEDAPDWQRESAMAGVTLHLENDVGPEASHEAWMAQKLADGWEKGKKKDADKKTHPCLVPFDKLPKEQQAKDFIFRAVVHALMG